MHGDFDIDFVPSITVLRMQFFGEASGWYGWIQPAVRFVVVRLCGLSWEPQFLALELITQREIAGLTVHSLITLFCYSLAHV